MAKFDKAGAELQGITITRDILEYRINFTELQRNRVLRDCYNFLLGDAVGRYGYMVGNCQTLPVMEWLALICGSDRMGIGEDCAAGVYELLRVAVGELEAR